MLIWYLGDFMCLLNQFSSDLSSRAAVLGQDFLAKILPTFLGKELHERH